MLCFRLFVLFAALAFALPAASALEPVHAPAEPAAEKVEIVTDQENGAVRILIDGKRVVIIDETGLHVRGDIRHGGTLTDYGPSGFDSHAVEAGQDEE